MGFKSNSKNINKIYLILKNNKKMITKKLLLLLLILQTSLTFAQKVSNISNRQVENKMIISYDLKTMVPCKVSLYVSVDGGITWQGPLLKVTGDVGDNITSGRHSISWNVLEEFEELRGDHIQFQVKSSGGDYTEEQKQALLKRKTTLFPYKKTNSSEFDSFYNRLNSSLNNIISNKKKGQLNFDLKIEFDTLGINKSKLYSINYSDSKFANELSLEKKIKMFSPSKLNDFFVASYEPLKFDINWSIEKVKYKSNSGGIIGFSQNDKNEVRLTNYIKSQNYSYGKFGFEVKNKSVNNTLYSDIKLLNYKTCAGPLSFVYSAIMPGMGTLKVTHGEKGWGRFAWFLISSGVAIGGKIYSDGEYTKYLSATNQTEIDKYYKTSNISNKISIASGGLAAYIYLHDIIWVFSKGIKNQNETKFLRKQLRNGPIEIQTQPITLE
jgi:hypothetical protein